MDDLKMADQTATKLQDMNMNMTLFSHNNNSADDYVQLNSCGCWIVMVAMPALKTIQ